MNGATNTPGAIPEEAEFSLRDFLDVVVRRRWIIVLALVPVLGGAVGWALAMPPVYQASATLTVDKAPLVVLLDRGGPSSLVRSQAAAQAPDIFTLAEFIRSQTVRDRTMERLKATLGTERAETALNDLSAQPLRDTELVRLTVEHRDPEIAAAAANGVAESLIDLNRRARRQRLTATREFTEKQLETAAQKLRASEAAIVAFKNRHGDVSLSEETNLNLRKLAELEAKRVELRLPHLEAKALIAMLESHLASLEIERSGLLRNFTSQHPALISNEAKIAESKRRLEAELARSRQLEQSRERAITATMGQYEGKLRAVPGREAELVRLTRNIKEAEAIYLLLSTEFQQALIAEVSIDSAIQLVDAARVPGAPARQRARKTALFGGALGLMLGVTAALLVEHLDETVKSAEDVERVLGAPVLGEIPLVVTGSGGNRRRAGVLWPLLVRLDDRSPVTEAYLALRTHVLSSIPHGDHCSLLVTSALPREGKSTIAANLALALARTGRQIWLVDCDLRHSGLGETFADGGSPGLIDLMKGEAELEDVVQWTEFPHLRFIPTGSPVTGAAELLSDERMGQMIGQARSRVDVVVLDSPAVLPAADAEVIGPRADGVLVVVRAGKTDRRALARTRQRLERIGVRVIGAVLNGVPDQGWSSTVRVYDGMKTERNGESVMHRLTPRGPSH